MSGDAPTGSAAASPPAGVFPGIALLSASLLVLEISLTRYFSFRLWYHYAFMIISIAMLGLSASSGVLAIARKRGSRIAALPVMTLGAGLCGTSVLIALPMLARLSALWGDGASSLASFGLLSLYWLILFCPFFLGGCAIAWGIDTYTSRIGVLYGWDLAGGALGCLAAVGLLSVLFPEQAATIAAAAALAAALLFSRAELRGVRTRRIFTTGAIILFALAALLVVDAERTAISPTVTPTKGLASDLRAGAKIVATIPGVTGRVDAIDAGRPSVWGIGTHFHGRIPGQVLLRIDGDALTAITRRDQQEGPWQFADFMPATLPYAMGRPGKVLIIGAGGGMDVGNALQHGAQEVVGVEINQAVIDMVTGPFDGFSGGLFRDPRVRLVHADGRNFVERTVERFDLIQLTLVDTFAAISSGALSLAEDFLYTREAFRAYVRALSPNGYLVMGRTPNEGLSLAVLVDSATRELGLDLSRHLFIAKHPTASHGLVMLFGRSPLDGGEVERGQRFVQAAGLQLLYAPGVTADLDPEIARYLGHPDRDGFVTRYGSDIVPETDDRPFYFRASKWSSLLGTYIGGRGNLFLILTISVVFGVGLILVPIALLAPTSLRRHWSLLAVFGCIGVGYIVLELGLMVQFTLLLGHPIRSLSVVLFSLLLFSGLGSYASQRLTAGVGGASTRATLPVLGVVILAAAYAFGLKPALAAVMGLDLPARIAIAVAIISPLGFLMGMPLPVAMARLKREQSDLVLWAWGINGTSSVIGSTACIVIAHALGYRSVILVAAACYVLAFLFLRQGRRS